ncbi:MAG TPA: hypothetical protein VLJ80_11140 [Solirubrobacteraceae bacterium]|nr:hypothetical protein [Solirubrobacteraceae bacterium]
MKLPRALIGALVAVAAMSAIAAAPASAAVKPQFLPEATAKVPIEFTAKHGITHFEEKNGFQINCEKGTGTGKVTGLKLGEFSTTFMACLTEGKTSCLGTGDKEQQITLKGAFHVWYVLLTKALQTGLVFLPTEAKIECGKTIVKLRGCMAGLVKPLNKKTKELVTEFKQEKGVNDIVEVFNEEEKFITCKLETARNSPEFEFAGVETVDTMTAFKKEGKEIEVEIAA